MEKEVIKAFAPKVKEMQNKSLMLREKKSGRADLIKKWKEILNERA